MTVTTENAPVAARTADEGDIETPEEERNDMSNSTANALLQPAPDVRMLADHNDVDVSVLPSYEIEYFISDLPAQLDQIDGQDYRTIGRIAIIPQRAIFRVGLYNGTNVHDRNTLAAAVQAIKDGQSRWAFQACESKQGWGRFYVTADLERPINPDVDRYAAKLTTCDRADCPERGGVHEVTDDGKVEHVAHELRRRTLIARVTCTDDRRWRIEIDVCQENTPKEAEDLAADLTKLAAECRRLNEARKAEAA